MKNKLIIGALSLLTVVSAGCSKSPFLDINTDPNNPKDVSPNVLLPSTTYSLAFANGNELARVASLLIQQEAGIASQAVGFDLLNLDGNFDNSWNFEIYSGALPPITKLIAKTQELGPHYAGIAKIQKAYLMSIATDLWGDVPYSQAGDIAKYPTPRFDKQQDIYQGNAGLGIQSLFDLVREGVKDLEKETPQGGFEIDAKKDDQVYQKPGFDLDQQIDGWIRMAHTLMLKLAITITNVNPDLAKSVINEVLADGRYIDDNLYDYDTKFGTAFGSQSPFYAFNVENRPTDMMMSARLVTLVNNMAGPLPLPAVNLKDYINLFYTRNGANFVGYENGSGAALPPAATRSTYGDAVIGTDDGFTYVKMINNSNRAFILAEAALILGTPGDPQALFKEGITASMQRSGFTASQISSFFALNAGITTLTGTTEQKRRQIIIWKYFSNIVNPLEAYNDWRRTGYPELQLPQNASGDDPTQIPLRFTYPPNETSANPNVPKPRPLTNQKVWWGK